MTDSLHRELLADDYAHGIKRKSKTYPAVGSKVEHGLFERKVSVAADGEDHALLALGRS